MVITKRTGLLPHMAMTPHKNSLKQAFALQMTEPVTLLKHIKWNGSYSAYKFELSLIVAAIEWNEESITRSPRKDTEDVVKKKVEAMSSAVTSVLQCIGEDPEREGLVKTPERFAKAMMFLTKGYTETLSGTSLG